ncbi:MAG: thiamine diphosphokinase [Bacteroidales bacterium]|nr:thiamine diphosphokinase [Bacteroidales bacterium]
MEQSAAILAAGSFPRKPYPLHLLRQADVLVCCDGALSAALRHGLQPRWVTGDMDSLPQALRKRYEKLVVPNPEQEFNDLDKAFRLLRERCPEARIIRIFGATGKAEDHTVGNLSYLMEWERRYGLSRDGYDVQMISDYSTAFAVGDSVTLQVGEGRKVSLFSPDASLQIRSEGLQWPTDAVVFDNWWKASLNRAAQDRIALHFNHPAPVLIILD